MNLSDPDLLHALLIGVGLSAACGFRVFVPLLGVSIACHAGYLQLSPEFAWLGSTPALLTFTVATVIEVGAYTVPFIDHLMDTLTTPAAVVAGTLLTASLLGDTSPWLKWSLAAIAGGGAAGIVQVGTMAVRGGSTLLTAGFGNLIVALLELAGSAIMTLLALLLPVVFLAALLITVFFLMLFVARRFSAKRPPANPDAL
jgi:hypothetical protein